ncbi:MAG TPA: hypothetical protein VG408_00795, partial [Actinomycetota bacterium]|nr:hypothetical protein [Actinomycetota bacterium]
MDTVSESAVHDRLVRIETNLSPKAMRAAAIAELDALFRGGGIPEPQPEGFLRGRLITMSMTRPTDAFVRGVASLYMPWLGKAFDPSTRSGVNVLTP